MSESEEELLLKKENSLYKTVVPIEIAGGGLRHFFVYIGSLLRFSGNFFGNLANRPLEWTEIRYQCEQIGVSSMPIAAMTLLFVGFVFAFQFGITLRSMGAVPYIGNVASLSILRELGPVFTALVVGGRVGAGMAAELGSMRVAEQIDAMRALGANPYKKLLVPRIFAATFMIPIVSLFASFIGIFGAMLVAWLEFNLSPVAFYESTIRTISFGDFLSGFFKPFFFGFAIAIIGCYHGFYCEFGTAGVGKTTTKAVVNISLMIVLVDFMLTRIFSLFW
jgi:phospholipid/cholesterol/gamma-HCH transport system permease protein